MPGSWVIGRNLAGYLPESETYAYATWNDAMNALEAEMRDYADTDDEDAIQELDSESLDDDWPSMLAHVGAIWTDDTPTSGDWSVQVPDSRDRPIVFWIQFDPTREPDSE